MTVAPGTRLGPGHAGSVPGFPLRGLAVCGTCRGHMTAERHEHRWGYYRCGRNAYRKELCRAKFCNADRAHRDMERICQQIRLSKATADAIRKAAERIIDERIASAEQRRQNLEIEQDRILHDEIRLTELFTAGDLSSNAYKAKTADFRTRRAALSKERGFIEVTREQLATKVEEVFHLATSLWDLYEQLPEARRTELLLSVFKAVVLGPEGVVGFTLRPPFDRFSSLTSPAAIGTSQTDGHELAKAILDVEASSVVRAA